MISQASGLHNDFDTHCPQGVDSLLGGTGAMAPLNDRLGYSGHR